MMMRSVRQETKKVIGSRRFLIIFAKKHSSSILLVTRYGSIILYNWFASQQKGNEAVSKFNTSKFEWTKLTEVGKLVPHMSNKKNLQVKPGMY